MQVTSLPDKIISLNLTWKSPLYSDIKSKLEKLTASNTILHLQGSLIGIEKESLRVNQDANISQKRHPQALGSALTNPYITTDYSEALIEFITPPLPSITKALNFIEDLHVFAYKKLDNEIFWATSMPCVVKNESNIPIAQYGHSNQGMMKTIYREGLGRRYGKTMQIIAGIHYNYSYSDDFWSHYHHQENPDSELQAFINDQYFSLIRNLLRIGWVIPYLFGASPAVCKSFFGDAKTGLDSFDDKTYFEPYATSLRMSDIGYQNNEENENGFKACYDTLDEYIANLKFAIETSCPEHEKIGIKEEGQYLQLNTNILQIENEYYSTVRPKQITQTNEKPINALKKRGVQYIELRSIDINAYDPFGINEHQLHFLEALMLFCLLTDSPNIDSNEREEIDKNEMLTALKGRKPGLELLRNGEKVTLNHWINEIFKNLKPICESLDHIKGTNKYSAAFDAIFERANDPEKTPSARMLREMKEKNEGFHYFAKRMSFQHNNYFKQLVLTKESKKLLEQEAKNSIEKQKQIEASDNISLDEFLSNYFNAN